MSTRENQANTTKWTKELRHMVALKAALWTNGNEDALLQRAATAYQEDIPLHKDCCFRCKTETNEILADYEIPDGRHVVIEGVPTMICPNCGNQEWDINVLAALEQYAEDFPDHSRTKLVDLLN